MAYFVKKSNTKKGLYLQIYFSYRDPQTKSPKNKSYCSIGYAQDLIDSGISDPIAYCQQKVDLLNLEFHQQKSQNKEKKIGETSPVRYSVNNYYGQAKIAYSSPLPLEFL